MASDWTPIGSKELRVHLASIREAAESLMEASSKEAFRSGSVQFFRAVLTLYGRIAARVKARGIDVTEEDIPKAKEFVPHLRS